MICGVTLSGQQEVFGCRGHTASQSHWLPCARLYAVMILTPAFPSWWMGVWSKAGVRGLRSVLGTSHESTPFAPSPTVCRSKLIPASLSLPRDKKTSIDTVPRPGGSCTISSWDSFPYPGIPEPQKWSPTRCLHPLEGRRGLEGQDPFRLLTTWPARGTFSAPCSILDCQPCLSQGRARKATRAQAAWVH